MASSLRHRSVEIELVGERLRRPETGIPVGADQPVVVFEGGGGTGKTALLERLAELAATGDPVPCAQLDLAAVESAVGESAVPEVLAALAFQLSRRVGRYGAFHFERLVLGLRAARLELDPHNPQRARGQVAGMLREDHHAAAVTQVLGDVAQEALRHVNHTDVDIPRGAVTALLEPAVNAATDWLVRGRRRGAGRFVAWWGDQDVPLGLDPVDELVRLNRLLTARDRAGRGDAHELLCGAFLADLRDNFATGRHADEWLANCLLLLDNADSPLGRELVRLLVGAEEDRRGRGGPPAPVTAVVTSRGALLGALPRAQAGAVREVRTPEDAALAPNQPRRVVWLRRRLPGLTPDDVHELVRQHALAVPNLRNAAELLHQFTGGHPGGTLLVLAELSRQDRPLLAPRSVLAAPRAGSRVEDVLFEQLTAGVPAEVLAVLTTCAAGRTRAEGLRLLARADTARQVDPWLLPADVWDPELPTTLLRTLLLRRLAARPPDHPWHWSAAHAAVRSAPTGQPGHRPDWVSAAHHALADDQLDDVVAELVTRLDSTPLPRWLSRVDLIATAPYRTAPPPPATGPAAGDHDTPAGAVRVLVTELRAVSDPLCDADRSGRYWQVAQAYRALARYRSDPVALFDVITHHEQLARQWHTPPRPGTGGGRP